MNRKRIVLLLALALASWATWSLVIHLAKPGPPTGVGLIVFMSTMGIALLGSMVICWNVFPQFVVRWWRRPLNMTLGVLSFLVILLVGHGIGLVISANGP